MRATNMTTAELVRYGLMYSDALPLPFHAKPSNA